MTSDGEDRFPAAYRRIIASWHTWEAVRRRKTRGRSTTYAMRTREPFIRLDDGGTLAFVDPIEISYYLVPEDDVYFIDSQERGSRKRYWMFRRVDDAEKFLLFKFSQAARPGKFSHSPAFRWYRAGLAPNVSLHHPDPISFPGRVTLAVDGESEDRGWMGDTDAIIFFPRARHEL